MSPAHPLDNDSISNLFTKNRNYPRLRARVIAELPRVYLSVVAVAEYLKFLQAGIRREWNARDAEGYETLYRFLEDIRQFNLCTFSAEDHKRYLKIPAKLRRDHPRDCRIAASAMARGYYVVTYNVSDFSEIGANCVTWSEFDPDEVPEWYRPERESPW